MEEAAVTNLLDAQLIGIRWDLQHIIVLCVYDHRHGSFTRSGSFGTKSNSSEFWDSWLMCAQTWDLNLQTHRTGYCPQIKPQVGVLRCYAANPQEISYIFRQNIRLLNSCKVSTPELEPEAYVNNPPRSCIW
jgi:hypothetical protein